MGDCRKGTVITMIYDHQPQQILIVSPNSVMLAKFETKSSRVKGIALHPKRPWVLCSLHDGQIQLWDYRVGTLLETFKEHNGPVRSVDFHCSQPLFVSGGDDYKIRVWNYNSKRSLYTLMGHKDYIRGVQFHTQNPWIVSCSDDQSIRIWNWQSRECIAVLQGHNHYVMSVQFHMTQDLVVSASLDQTIRVWDISALKQKGKTVPGLNPVPATVMGRFGIDNVATVKYILEGHERGVNWASFHHELPLIVSGSDDRMIKIWRTNESKAWEVDTMRGHTNNVNCVLFHPHEDLILSVSEDHSIRVWDSTKRICNQTFMRTRDRFWCLATHPTKNCVAAGHDSGAVVFKLSRERTPADVLDTRCFYVLNRGYQMCDVYSGKNQTTIMQITRGAALSASEPRELMVNPFSSSEYMILVFNRSNGGSYEMVRFPQNSSDRIIPEVVSGNALGAAFIGRAKFATLESNDTLFIRNADNIVGFVSGISRLGDQASHAACGRRFSALLRWVCRARSAAERRGVADVRHVLAAARRQLCNRVCEAREVAKGRRRSGRHHVQWTECPGPFLVSLCVCERAPACEGRGVGRCRSGDLLHDVASEVLASVWRAGSHPKSRRRGVSAGNKEWRAHWN